MQATGRTLGQFLRAWWSVGRLFADRERLEPDTVAAMVAASATVEPPPMRAAWRTTPYAFAPEPSSYSDWERIVLSQIADLADRADAGPVTPLATEPDGAGALGALRWADLARLAVCGQAYE
jgi:hypothetical protein